MTIDIKVKLIMALDNKLDEAQVVYILSRIRKIMELENLRNSYKLLNIYCNWSLHCKIDRTEDIRDILEEFVSNADARPHLLYFDKFKEQFKLFVKEVLNKDIDNTYLNNFIQLLTLILSDTPISFRKSKLISITINPSSLTRKENEITYQIVESEL